MDIGQLIFPFIMAVITNSIMIVIIYFLRKIPYFSNLFSVWFMVGLYLLCVLRIFLPIEFPDVQIILRDRYLFRFLINGVVDRADDSYVSPSSGLYIIICLWLVGVVIFAAVSIYTQRTKTTYYLANFDFTTDKEKKLFDQISSEILGEKPVLTLKKTDAVTCIMVVGYFNKYLLLPDKEYSDNELEMIFRHECTHIKNKDLWLKLLVHIYCCIFWWNPFAYLLKHDLGFTLEMKCDLSAARDMTYEEKKLYFDALKGNCRTKKKYENHFFICAEFSDAAKNKDLIKRTKALASDEPNKVGQIVVDSLIALIFVGVFTASYIFIWQPFYSYDTSNENYGLADNESVVNGEDAFLVKQDDYYLFYVAGFPPETVSAEDVEEGMYEGFPIREE